MGTPGPRDMKRITNDVQSRGRGVIERLALEVPFATIENLSKAVKLEMRLGSDEFELNKHQLDDLREWVDQFPAARTKAPK